MKSSLRVLLWWPVIRTPVANGVHGVHSWLGPMSQMPQVWPKFKTINHLKEMNAFKEKRKVLHFTGTITKENKESGQRKL